VAEPALEPGWVAPELADELPGLGLAWARVDARAGRSPEPVRRRMRELAGRFTGGRVVQSRQDEVPWAYRVLWRRLGLDPDSDRTPVERLMVERLEVGGLPSHGMPDDAVVVATLETGVPVLALDAASVDGAPGLRPATAGERLGGDELRPLPGGEVVYADERQPIARLTGEVAAACRTGDETTVVLLCALTTSGVSAMAVEEAIWTAADLLEAAGSG
jgi:DNA/RNA-binding domain of Phe-tRNA-synthetase-like protein